MSEAVCIMNNCRNRAPATEAFCARHRPKKPDLKEVKEVLRRARWYVNDALEAHRHDEGEELLADIDRVLRGLSGV